MLRQFKVENSNFSRLFFIKRFRAWLMKLYIGRMLFFTTST